MPKSESGRKYVPNYGSWEFLLKVLLLPNQFNDAFLYSFSDPQYQRANKDSTVKRPVNKGCPVHHAPTSRNRNIRYDDSTHPRNDDISSSRIYYTDKHGRVKYGHVNQQKKKVSCHSTSYCKNNSCERQQSSGQQHEREAQRVQFNNHGHGMGYKITMTKLKQVMRKTMSTIDHCESGNSSNVRHGTGQSRRSTVSLPAQASITSTEVQKTLEITCERIRYLSTDEFKFSQ